MSDEGIRSISVEPLTVIVLQEGTVIHEGTVLPEGTVLQEASVLEEEVEGLLDDRSLEQGSEEIVIDCKEGDEDKEDIVSTEEIIQQESTVCPNCQADFLSEQDLNKHRETCLHKVLFICVLCKEHFDCRGSLKFHYRFHSAEGIPISSHIESPENTETREKKCISVSCMLCDQPFGSKTLLNKHLIEKHSQAKVFDVGGPSPPSSQDERFKCERCPRSFSRFGSLNYHVSRKHSGTLKGRSASEFPYLCTYCGNRYKSATQLCRHQSWECGKEPMFKCQLCTKKFHHRHGLKQHIRLHLAKKGVATKVAQYFCEKCGRGYQLNSSLKNHVRWECGKEPVFACTLCAVKFFHKGNLKKHTRAKHGENLVGTDVPGTLQPSQ